MLSPRWRKVLRDVWLHKARTVLVVAAIAVGIVGAGAVLDTWSLVRRVTTAEFDASLPASATLLTDSIDQALLVRVRAMPALADAQARRTVTASVRTRNGSQAAMLFATDDFARNRVGVLKPEQGEWPPRDGSIVIESSSVEYSAVQLGDSLSTQFGDRDAAALRVSGITRDVGLAPGWMEHIVYAFVTQATLRQLGAPASLNELQILVKNRSMNREAVRRVAADVKSLVESTGRAVSDVAVPEPGRHVHAAQIGSLLFTQGAFGVLALLLSGILVVNLISAMLAGQLREIGIMKAIGARPAQIAAMYLAVALVLGLVASAIAIPIAAVIGRWYAQFTADLLNFDISGFAIPSSVILLQLGVGALLPVVAATIPVVKGSRIGVNDALRDLGISFTAGTSGAWLSKTGSIARPLLLSLRNAFRRRQRMALTLVTLSTGGAVYLGAVNLRAAIVASVDMLFAVQPFDMSVRLAEPHAPDSVEAVVRGVAGVARAEAWAGARAILRRNDGSVGDAFPIAAPPAATTLLVPRIVDGRWMLPSDTNALVVNRRLLSEEPTMMVGSRVTLLIAGMASEWTVVGAVETGPSLAAYAARETIAPMVGSGRVSAVVVSGSVNGAAADFELLQRLRSSLADAGFPIQSGQLMTQQRSVIEDHLLMVAGFLGSMSLLMIVVGGLGLASTMSLAVLERTREIGVMRAIGARHRSIVAIVQIEGLVIALLSWLVALPLSLPMSVILGRAFGRVMLEVPVILVPETSGVLVWLAVVVGVSVVACAWPAFRAMRVPVARALAYE